jgi:hypothetical protein
MRQILSCIYYILIALGCFQAIGAEEQIDLDESPVCTKQELMAYFPQILVKKVLLSSGIKTKQAIAISEELSQKGQELEKIVAEKASKLDPNPFKDLSQRDVAIKIYRETLYEVFAKVLKSHGINDEDQIQVLLDKMQLAKSKMFIDCIRKEQSSSKTNLTPVPSS